MAPYAPTWNPVLMDYPHVTLDLSHTAVSGSDALAMAGELGGRLAHVHLADGTGLANRDEHLVPGRGTQPCAPLLGQLAAEDYPGIVVLEVKTFRAATQEARLADLAEALEFTRAHLAGRPAERAAGRHRPAGRRASGTATRGTRANGAAVGTAEHALSTPAEALPAQHPCRTSTPPGPVPRRAGRELH